jgi:hypothetical protein
MCKLLHAKMMLFEMRLFVQEAKLACTSFPPQWNDVVQDALVLLQDGKLSCASFTHGGMMLFEMCLCFCKRES